MRFTTTHGWIPSIDLTARQSDADRRKARQDARLANVRDNARDENGTGRHSAKQ